MIIDGNFKNYEIKLLNNNKKLITFRDAQLLFPSSLKGKGQVLVQDYHTDKFNKVILESGYGEKKHYQTVEEFEKDNNELSYLFYDCLILLCFLINIDFSFPRKHWKITAGSTAYNRWKYGFFTERIVKEYLESGKLEVLKLERGIENYRFKGTKKYFHLKRIKDKIFRDFFFPRKQEKIHNQILGNWFYGGLTNFNPQNQGLVLDNLIKLDITSSYPSVMMEKNLPYGWIYEGEKEGCDFKFFRIYAKSDLKNKEGLPFIKVTNKNKSKPYLSTIPRGTYLYLTSVEIDNFSKFYQGKYKTEIIYSTATIKGSFLFKEYIDFYFNLKATAKNKIEKIIAKLMLNSLFGKFGTKRVRSQRIYYQEEYLELTNLTENEYYTPIATAITAYGRMKLVDLIGKNYEIFIGGDTDSVIIPSQFRKNLSKFIGNNLGEWKVEMEEMKGVFRRKKQYFYYGKEDGKFSYSFAFASLNSEKIDKDNLTFSEFCLGKEIPNQTRPKRLPMGIMIENYVKKIIPIYDKSYQKTDEGLNLWFHNEDEYKGNYQRQLKIRKEILKNYQWKD